MEIGSLNDVLITLADAESIARPANIFVITLIRRLEQYNAPDGTADRD